MKVVITILVIVSVIAVMLFVREESKPTTTEPVSECLVLDNDGNCNEY